MRDLYFDSIEELVHGVAELLRSRDWEALAACHHLEMSTVSLGELQLESTYLLDENERFGHPVSDGFHYPFPPSFEYLFAEPTLDDNPKTYVRVGIEIDSGAGQIQRGEQRFAVVGTAKGWQLVRE